ncbi:MAG: aminoacetone oxidase family FAD-binding enzyme [Ruminococcaceae bacterium]|nr:aminoacetone oxidase family FAD-binding enzyme [Oscillospiraceae bacterium]
MAEHFDIAVIGGGAGGLFFTALAAKMHKELRFTVIEKNPRVGKKLLVTGNGRCNLTNIYTSVSDYHGSFSPYIKTILDICPPQKILDLFLEMGLVTRADDFGRVYPKSNQASSVLDVLRFNCEKDNVSFFCDNKVEKIEKRSNSFAISTDKSSFTAQRVIFATGGAAAPKAGGDKSGYEILKKLGHKIITPSPSLCPIMVKSDYLKSLKGIRVQGEVLLLENGKTISNEIGEIQFTENALSGICVFNLSQYIESKQKYTLRVKMMPENEYNEIVSVLLNNRRVFATLEAENLMTGIFHKRIAQALMKATGINLNKKVEEISEREIKTLAKVINNFDFEVIGPSDFGNAQVTKGGVSGLEVNPDTMESKIVKGLYIIGEALDCNGDCGGYNLQFAFATGYLATLSL